MTVPAKSGAPEILRSFQKDESFLEYLKSKIANLVQNSLGTYYWLQYHKVIEILCELLYYGVTTLSLRQTLGEEYTGILQYNRASNQLPSFVVRLLSVVIQCGGPYAVQKLVNRFEKSLTSGSLSTYLKPEIKFILLNQIPLLKLFPALFLKLHLAAFYINGSFYHLSKRITGINYILVRNWLGNNSVGNTFKIIGVVLFLNAVLSSCYSIYEILKKKNLKNKIRYTSGFISWHNNLLNRKLAMNSSLIPPKDAHYAWELGRLLQSLPAVICFVGIVYMNGCRAATFVLFVGTKLLRLK